MRPFLSFLLSLIVAAILLPACDERVAMPKPRAYPRVIYPKKKYIPFRAGGCPFTFEMPEYAEIEQDVSFFDEGPKSDCWFTLHVRSLNAQLHCSYYPINSRTRFDELVQDAFTMAQKHNIKANYIEEIPVYRSANRVYGVVFHLEGPTASFYQFFLTDSVRHFLRGALYFRTQARPDSLAPVLDFMRQDMNRLIETLRWQAAPPKSSKS
ncbi:MAG: hypothetical protein NZM43_04480 [Saprospiraceae bacterium]|nr:hypothetical protein [Saprospiraceae bacterium]MDW8483565.1 hypothetical protein [Saprospiraceae bacterium]